MFETEILFEYAVGEIISYEERIIKGVEIEIDVSITKEEDRSPKPVSYTFNEISAEIAQHEAKIGYEIEKPKGDVKRETGITAPKPKIEAPRPVERPTISGEGIEKVVKQEDVKKETPPSTKQEAPAKRPLEPPSPPKHEKELRNSIQLSDEILLAPPKVGPGYVKEVPVQKPMPPPTVEVREPMKKTEEQMKAVKQDQVIRELEVTERSFGKSSAEVKGEERKIGMLPSKKVKRLVIPYDWMKKIREKKVLLTPEEEKELKKLKLTREVEESREVITHGRSIEEVLGINVREDLLREKLLQTTLETRIRSLAELEELVKSKRRV
ncbi:MAG: hypothetical protein QXP42_02305 [Candidatus Micrarchaeia archaeon]